MYDDCMGRYPPDHDDCNSMLFYPDWHGANKGCLDDGKLSVLLNIKLFVFVQYYLNPNSLSSSLQVGSLTTC